MIEKQQKQIEELLGLIKNTNGNKGTGINNIPINLSDKNICILNQNVPNPFAESTVITYNIPQDFTKAQIIFSNELGNVIKVVDIKEKGQGTLSVFADDLTHGIYAYDLIVDGKKIDGKKMVKE